ncbi:MAG: rRNA pseudouridine synthase [Prosthecobacter sp.]|uniref:pseudouridine synthase n=1 Tax=Prosthecobacter sp. TaxID=1965333 RepID=UPI0019FABB83|nr:pseudouridine synthase [Prosthecobacter sp.]MBE2284535.1 rRNA pseudouridine synthase [Prosthecobacter sp.]
MRLNRYLSQCGVASRRGAEQIILEGRVSINGHIITELATQVQPEDKVVVDGSPVRTELPLVIALNKPKGYLCSRGDTHERMTIYDLLPLKFQSLHHVGRLDKESEGLILLTNRGELSHRLIHPSQGAEKEYEVTVDQPLTIEVMAKLVKGMQTEEGYARAERAWMDGAYHAHVVLKQGLKRQIRLMFYALGYEVVRLVRIRIGWLQLKGLPKGGWKELTPTEVERFFKEEPSKPKLGRKTASEAEGAQERRPPRPARESGAGEKRFKPSRGKRSGPSARFSDELSDEKPSRFKPKRDSFSSRSRSGGAGRPERPGGRSGPQSQRPAPRGPRRGPRPR